MADLSMMAAVEAVSPTPPPLPAAIVPPVAAIGFEGVVEGKVFSPPRFLVYGLDGIGKSTFASGAPRPIFIQAEKGLDQLGPARFPIAKTFEAVVEQLTTVATQPHQYQTVVIDSVTGLEKLIFDRIISENAICAGRPVDVITEVKGGFRKGENMAASYWQKVTNLLSRCNDRGMAVILVGHQGKEDAGNPETPMLKVIGPSIDKKASEYIRQWVDATVYITRRVLIGTVGQGVMERPIAKAVGADGGERIMVCNGSPMLHAKNRYELPTELPFPKEGAFNLLMQYVSAHFKKESK